MKKNIIRILLIPIFLFAFTLIIINSNAVHASFIQDAGIQSGNPVGATTTSNDNTWLKFSQSVNSNTMNITSWTGYPLLASIFHLQAMIYGYPDKTGVIKPRTGAYGALSGLINSMYAEKPLSSINYIAYLSGNTPFIKPAVAQGLPTGPGYDFFPNAIFRMWQGMRNLSYVLLVVVLVAIGFMVMFRFKIDPQTVASIQDSIPRIVVSLILITISYALVGFVVDIAYLGSNLIVWILGNALNINNKITLDIFSIVTGVGNKGFGGVDIFARIGGGLLTVLTFSNLNGLITLIIAFALISSTIKIFFSLLTKYVTIIMGAIFIPLTILWGTLPGQYDTFPKFFKGLISAALSFPAVILFLSLASYFADPAIPNMFKDLQPITGMQGAGNNGQIVNFNLNLLVSLGLLMTTPNIPQIIDDALSVKASAVGAGVGESAGFLRKIPIVGSLLG